MLAAPEPVPVAEINLDSLPPKTPAADADFSPPSTEPSTSRPDNKDTPPPGDVSSGNQTGQAGRPSRRARPQVSYKEPSLAVKMRRDGKMADAIVPQTDRRTSVEVKLAPLTTGRVAIKREIGEEEAEAGSPLRQKLDRRENASPPELAQTNPCTTSKAISALIDQTSTANRRASSNFVAKSSDEPASQRVETGEPVIKEEATEKDNLAIFDLPKHLQSTLHARGPNLPRWRATLDDTHPYQLWLPMSLRSQRVRFRRYTSVQAAGQSRVSATPVWQRAPLPHA